MSLISSELKKQKQTKKGLKEENKEKDGSHGSPLYFDTISCTRNAMYLKHQQEFFLKRNYVDTLIFIINISLYSEDLISATFNAKQHMLNHLLIRTIIENNILFHQKTNIEEITYNKNY